jgi:hypothetical protein
MATYIVNDGDLSALRGSTILIIGAATGIGRAAVKLAFGQHRRPPKIAPTHTDILLGGQKTEPTLP